MIIGFALALTIAALTFVLFVRAKDIPEPVPVSPIQHLEDRKQAIYENLRDLQFEFRLGKLSDEDYQQTKLALQKELAVVLSEMDGTIKRLGLTATRVHGKTVAARSAAAAKAPPPAKTRVTTCPHCGASFSQALKFCGECGKAIS